MNEFIAPSLPALKIAVEAFTAAKNANTPAEASLIKARAGANMMGIKTIEQQLKPCYQCDELVIYLFDDSRCSKCTRTDPDKQ